ncbi:hypothetical protein BZA77DRAFT_143447 [Pyronema omphalodes]|nr:hypothetical protein BZA77DRAFT_143447 [Pyronema omphalodes]
MSHLHIHQAPPSPPSHLTSFPSFLNTNININIRYPTSHSRTLYNNNNNNNNNEDDDISNLQKRVGIVLAIILILMFMRGIFVRRTQMAKLAIPHNQAVTQENIPGDNNTSSHRSRRPPEPSRPQRFVARSGQDGGLFRFSVGVGDGGGDGGGGWRDGRDYNNQSGPRWPPAVATSTRTSIEEPLPMYEAAPPTYDALYKNGPPQTFPGTIPAVANDESSRAANEMEEGRVLRNTPLITRPETAVVADGGHPVNPPAGSGVNSQQGTMGRVGSRRTSR